MAMPTETDRHYAMGILAAKKAMSNGNQFSAMVNQAEEVLAKETPEAEAARLRIALEQIAATKNDTLGTRDGAEDEKTQAFDRGCRMAFYRCAAIASEALQPQK